jgi:hypothetical protein
MIRRVSENLGTNLFSKICQELAKLMLARRRGRDPELSASGGTRRAAWRTRHFSCKHGTEPVGGLHDALDEHDVSRLDHDSVAHETCPRLLGSQRRKRHRTT